MPHCRLLNKLRLLGIDGAVVGWVKSFLGGRTQRVCVDGALSDNASVLSGVPLGTILGHLLFLIFIDDVPSVVDPCTQIRLFADDCLIYRHIHSVADQLQLQRDLDKI